MFVGILYSVGSCLGLAPCLHERSAGSVELMEWVEVAGGLKNGKLVDDSTTPGFSEENTNVILDTTVGVSKRAGIKMPTAKSVETS